MGKPMRIALIADTFPPLRTSGAVQLRDLSREFVRQGHTLTVMLPTAGLNTPWLLEDFDGVQVLRLRAPQTKDINYVSRTINEFLMPFAMLRNLRKSPLAAQRWDGVVWYAPTIFLGPMANAQKKASACRSYLIIRDIFPEWAVDMGLMGRGLPYQFFKAVERHQYAVADVIGVQTPANMPYFDHAQCHVGIVALDPRHKTHNVPGKFLSYMQSGLPVLASINPGNDLVGLIDGERIGRVCTDHSVETLQRLALELLHDVAADPGMAGRCKALSARLFSPEAVVKQITAALGV
jgi:glycosyltransferase involved in cell wall biosynthesis